MNNKQYEPVIGLEIHVELKTKSKMFCGCDANHFGVKPNIYCCPVCLGLPGALPVPNRVAIEWCALLGKALNCTISSFSKFDRKNYFYPDLPKGYQISQYDKPIAVNGYLSIKSTISHPEFISGSEQMLKPLQGKQVQHDNKTTGKSFRIHRVHLEEDTGKLIHQREYTLVDFNRSGVPLVEIVTEPDFRSSEDVVVFLKELHTIIRYLEVSDADMEKGSMRMEPNISVRTMSNVKGQMSNQTQNPNFKLPNYKVEVKNINSFNFVKRAIDYEIKRHIMLLEQGKIPAQETRGWDSNKNITYSQRSKEDAHDYRYFPEPDIPPFEFSDEYIESIRKKLPELPQAKMYRFIDKLKLKPIDAFTLTREKETSEFYEKVMSKLKSKKLKMKVKNQILEQEIANYIVNKKISTSLSIDEFVKKATEMMKPVETDSKLLEEIIKRILSVNPKVVTDYKSGKQNAIMFLVGQVMREMKGKAEANNVIVKLKEMLK